MPNKCNRSWLKWITAQFELSLAQFSPSLLLLNINLLNFTYNNTRALFQIKGRRNKDVLLARKSPLYQGILWWKVISPPYWYNLTILFRSTKFLELMDNAEKSIEKVNADQIYTSKQFKRIKDEFQVNVFIIWFWQFRLWIQVSDVWKQCCYSSLLLQQVRYFRIERKKSTKILQIQEL